MKRAQMELMGVAVIVLLISVGFMFFLKFNLTKADKPLQKNFQKATIPTYFINSLLETTISPTACDIEGHMKDLISDCILFSGCVWDGAVHDIDLDPPPMSQEFLDIEPYTSPETNFDCIQCANGMQTHPLTDEYVLPPTSCGYLFQTLQQVLDATVEEQGKHYEFIIENVNEVPILEVRDEGCKNRASGATEYKEFILANGERIIMTICD